MPSFGSRGGPLLLPLFTPPRHRSDGPPALGAGGALGPGPRPGPRCPRSAQAKTDLAQGPARRRPPDTLGRPGRRREAPKGLQSAARRGGAWEGG